MDCDRSAGVISLIGSDTHVGSSSEGGSNTITGPRITAYLRLYISHPAGAERPEKITSFFFLKKRDGAGA